jgi:hypothetical protein
LDLPTKATSDILSGNSLGFVVEIKNVEFERFKATLSS